MIEITGYFHPRHQHPTFLEWPCLRTAWVRLSCLRIDVGRFRSCLYKWSMTSSAPCECGSEEQPSTMLSSIVQSVDLRVECMASRFWMTKQSNGCSTPAPKSSSAANTGLKELLIRWRSKMIEFLHSHDYARRLETSYE